MTDRLYLADSHLSSCSATVTACHGTADGYDLELDRSVFFPNAGGQPSDTGTFTLPDGGTVAITGADELDDGTLFHHAAAPVAPGTAVTAAIDWDRRFDLMQQHSGEHMVSGVIHRRWGYENVGFHMGADMITIDLSGELTMEDLREVEQEVNSRIWRDDRVKIWYPSPEELKEIPYRSKKELTGAIRIVEFPGADICACCGTHVERTGAIGLVKLLTCTKFHEGVRVEMLCGGRAVDYLTRAFDQNRLVSQQLSAKVMETAQAVAGISAELAEKKQQLYAMEEAAFAARAKELTGAGDVAVFLENLNPDGVRRAAVAIQDTCSGRAAVFSGSDETGYKYAVGLPGGDLRTWVREFNSALKGRGGGKPFFVQGSLQASRAEIEAYLSCH